MPDGSRDADEAENDGPTGPTVEPTRPPVAYPLGDGTDGSDDDPADAEGTEGSTDDRDGSVEPADGDGTDVDEARGAGASPTDRGATPPIAGRPASGTADSGDSPETGDRESGSEVTTVREVVDGRDGEPEGDESASGEAGSVEVERDRRQPGGEEVGDRARGPAAPDERPNDREGEDQDARSEEDLEREILDAEERIGHDEQYCHDCGAVFSARKNVCPDCGNPFPGHVDPPASSRKMPRLAAGLSMVLPGAGQLYNEQFGKATLAFFGTVFLVGFVGFVGLVLNAMLTLFSLGFLSWLGTFIMVLAILFGWFLPVSVVAWDAYDEARKMNAG